MSDGVSWVIQENLGTLNTSEPSGLGVGTSARDSTELFVDWSVWMSMVLSKYATVSGSGFRGHQETQNTQSSVVRSCSDIRNGVK